MYRRHPFSSKNEFEINANECKKCNFLHFNLSPLPHANVFYTGGHTWCRTTECLYLMQISSQYVFVFILKNNKIICKINQILDLKRADIDHCSAVSFMRESFPWCVPRKLTRASSHLLRWAIARSRRNRQQNTRKAVLADNGWFYSPSKLQVLLKQLNQNLKMKI